MGEMKVAGELIQMNSHMELTGSAATLVILGALIAIAFAIGAIIVYDVTSWKASTVLIVCAMVGIAIMIVGFNRPKEQIVHACANGPVSLEQIAVKYDIISVDGKELKLRVR